MNAEIKRVLRELCGLRNFGSKFGLDRMRALMRELGDPQNDVPAIHIAGTNGKGSTAAMCEALLREEGFKTGLYTSPHLLRLGERIQINRRTLDDEKTVGLADDVCRAAKIFGKPGDPEFPSFFEIMTAAAFLHFSRERCDYAVFETGLGGRLDATNILEPSVAGTAVITSIGLDHCEILGGTYEEIAGEKSGIIKPGQRVFSGWLPESAMNVVRETCRSRGAELLDLTNEKNLPKTNLFGEHQRRNAALALAAVQSLLKKTVPATALTKIDWPGRWQHFPLADGRTIVIDVSHNEECAKALDGMLEKFGKKITAVVGVLGEARAKAVLAVIAKHASKIILVRPAQERACTLDGLRACVPADFAGTVECSSVKKLFPKPAVCTETVPADGALLVSGSCYLAGETLAALTGTPDFQTHLQDKINLAGKPVF